MHGKRRKKHGAADLKPVEINVTPMIDMFSVLNSFLLMTAVFSGTGQHRVEIPFLSSKPPPTEEEVKNKPEPVVTAIIDETQVSLEIGTSDNSTKVVKETFNTDEIGLDAFQAKLYSIRTADPKFDKVTVMTELEVNYESLTKVIDAMRELRSNRTPIPLPPDYKLPVGIESTALIPKIVFGNVIL